MKTTYKLINKTLLILFVLGTFAPAAKAQVKGISYSLSPVGEYLDWEKNTGISNGFMVGGHLGFGFGEFVELRGTYLQSLDMKRNFGPLNLKELQGVELSQPGIDVTRWGGDLKLNLARGSVVPFLTAGTGVQTFKSDSLATFKNIYVSLGGGFQFVVADRYTLGIQAVNTSFNGSPVRNLTTAAERDANGLAVADYDNELLKNWSLRASLSFYLGGRRPGELTDLDKAYLNNFSGGFSLPIEITAGQLDFDKALPYANTKYVGAATGFNFGPYVGLRGYYWRAMDTDYFSSFDRLAVYGGEGKFKLANGQGLTPSINIGGGVIDALKGYEVDGVELDEKNRPFVSGGLGLDIPFGRAFKLTAYGKALLTSNDPLENATNPDELATSWAYGLSANLIIGNGVKNVQTEKEESYDELVKNNMKREKNRAKDLKEEYEDRIDQLTDEIKDARDDNNRRLANDLEDDREALKDAVDRIDEIQKQEEKANEEANRKEDPLLMKMKPTDFAKKMDEIENDAPKNQKMSERNDRDSDRNDRDRSRSNMDRDRDSETDSKALRALEERLQSIEDKLDDIQQQNNDYRQNQQNYRNGNSRNGDSRDGNSRNGDSRNNRRDYNDQENRNQNGNSRNGAFRNDNSRNGNSRNNDSQNGDSRNSDSRNNSNNYDRRNFNGNGASSRNGAYEPQSDEAMEMLNAERQKSEELRAAYEDRIEKLEEEVKSARQDGNAQIEEDLNAELKAMQEGIQKIKEAQERENEANRDASQRNDPAQLQKQTENFRSELDAIQRDNERYRQQIERSMQDYKRQNERQMNERRDNQQDNRDVYRLQMENEMDQLRQEIRELKYNRSGQNATSTTPKDNSDSLGTPSGEGTTITPDEGTAMSSMTNLGQRSDEQLAYESENIAQTGFFNRFNYDGSSAIAGINLGGATTFNIGFRNHYRYQTSNLYAMPEAFFGFGEGSSFGLFLNGIYNLKLKNQADFSPYAGLGLGIMKIGNNDSNSTKAAFNIVLGANLFKIANGRFYVDVSARNLFKYTQLAAGYRLPF